MRYSRYPDPPEPIWHKVVCVLFVFGLIYLFFSLTTKPSPSPKEMVSRYETADSVCHVYNYKSISCYPK